jgi:hypothetical protein
MTARTYTLLGPDRQPYWRRRFRPNRCPSSSFMCPIGQLLNRRVVATVCRRRRRGHAPLARSAD